MPTIDLSRILYLTELTGLKVFAPDGERIGRIVEAAVAPTDHPKRVARYLVGDGGRTRFMIRFGQVRSISLKGLMLSDDLLTPYRHDESFLLLRKDLLDQQIIDANGRKVVRVNDMTLTIESVGERQELWVLEVDVGVRGAFRRLLEGVAPPATIRRLQEPIKPNSIRWEYCNLIEPDPQRRLKLNIATDMLNQLHPADLADIVEDLPPAEREALIETLDDEVAADTLTEVEPKIQASILESLDSDKAADLLEDMAPDEAADALAEVEEDVSREILGDMEHTPAAEIGELLEYKEDSAGGMMNTRLVALHENATVRDAVEALRGSEELLESLNMLFLVGPGERLVGAVPLARLFVLPDGAPLRDQALKPLLKVSIDTERDEVIEYFDKYNILTLPVVDEENKLQGVITADDVISALRQK
ncbi:MAG: magnesium transporter [Acidobacteria bacterium]|nr:magnesium transporter [Acidobacteriota bacterium]